MTQRGLMLVAPTEVAIDDVLTPRVLSVLAEVTRTHGPRLFELLRMRKERQERLDAGTEKLAFLEDTTGVRNGNWKVGTIPADLLDRRVEITGPVDRKMILNA